ncbi:hypothetical protein Cgig2_029423 [Carnegiea gigantea]|uniref:Uncharacterized protein n=1 Tax=Carnegiea gigantea TaxID=171969 RepID=A0A9Q1JKK0_9CARY|nr:hypothetical protein Cgig2_029423 [Carnegiea gigantea]
MAFLCSLDTKAMGEYVTRHFAWDRRGVPSPPSPLPKDFQALCPSFELAVAEKATEYYELPELPQVIFYAMSCKDRRFGLWSRPLLSSIGTPLSRGSGCMVTGSSKLDSAQRSNQGRVQEPVDRKKAQKWSRRIRTRPLKRRPPLRMVMSRGEAVKPMNAHLPLLVFSPISLLYCLSQHIERPIDTPVFPCYGVPFYLQHVGDGQLREGVLQLAMEERFASALPLSRRIPCLMPTFSLSEAEGAAAEFELFEIVQATFYATLLNEAIKPGVAHDLTAESMKSSLVGLRRSTFKVWMGYIDHVLRAAQLQRPTYEVEIRGSLDGQEEGSGSNSPRPPLVTRIASTPPPLVSSIQRWRSPDELLAEGTQGPSAPGNSVLKRKGCAPGGLVTEIVAEGSEFSGAPTHSDPQDGPGSHFPDPKVVPTLKRSTFEKQYLLPTGYTFVIPDADATVNEPPTKCIVVYRTALNYGLWFPLHPVIVEILNKYELAPAQRAPKETGDLRWYCFNNRSGCITAIEKKSKVKHWKYDFLFVHRESGWGDVPDWNEGKPMRNPFGEPTAEERKTARYFQFHIREDDRPRPIPKFMAQAIESVKGPERRKSKSSEREPLNWLPKSSEGKVDGFRDQGRHPGAPSIVPRGKKPAISLPVQKRQRTEGHPDEAAASTPLPVGRAKTERSAPHRSGSRSSGDRTPIIQKQAAPSKTIGVASQAAGGSSPITQRPSTNFIKADPTAKLSLVQDLVKSRDLVTPGASDLPKVTEEEIATAELRADLDAREAEKKGLPRQLEEALVKAEAEVAQAKEHGYQQGHVDTLGYLRKVLMTLAQEFKEDSHFEAYLHYVDERQQAADEGRDPEKVEFIPPSAEGEDAGDEATNPLDAKAGASELEGHEDSGEPDA